MKRAAKIRPRLERPIVWIGSSLDDLSRFPRRAKSTTGYALRMAQRNEVHDDAKPMRGPLSGLIEIVAHDESNRTFRTVYAAKLGELLYVLHAFCKKSTRGIATPQRELDLIERRWHAARKHHGENHDEIQA